MKQCHCIPSMVEISSKNLYQVTFDIYSRFAAPSPVSEALCMSAEERKEKKCFALG